MLVSLLFDLCLAALGHSSKAIEPVAVFAGVMLKLSRSALQNEVTLHWYASYIVKLSNHCLIDRHPEMNILS